MEPKKAKEILDSGGAMRYATYLESNGIRKARCPFCGKTNFCKHYYWDTDATTACYVGYEKEIN